MGFPALGVLAQRKKKRKRNADGLQWKSAQSRLAGACKILGLCVMLNELHKLSEKVFGTGWQSKLARHIDTNPRTVRRWVSGEIPVPTVVILYLKLVIKHKVKIKES